MLLNCVQHMHQQILRAAEGQFELASRIFVVAVSPCRLTFAFKTSKDSLRHKWRKAKIPLGFFRIVLPICNSNLVMMSAWRMFSRLKASQSVQSVVLSFAGAGRQVYISKPWMIHSDVPWCASERCRRRKTRVSRLKLPARGGIHCSTYRRWVCTMYLDRLTMAVPSCSLHVGWQRCQREHQKPYTVKCS